MLNPTIQKAAPIARNTWRSWIQLALMVYLLLLAVSTIGSGFKLATAEQASTLFQFASHPVTGLMIGLVATALIQSSSTVTSIIVGLVAGGLPVEMAIPIILAVISISMPQT